LYSALLMELIARAEREAAERLSARGAVAIEARAAAATGAGLRGLVARALVRAGTCLDATAAARVAPQPR
jgi:hypothetical protein